MNNNERVIFACRSGTGVYLLVLWRLTESGVKYDVYVAGDGGMLIRVYYASGLDDAKKKVNELSKVLGFYAEGVILTPEVSAEHYRKWFAKGG